MTRQLKKDEIYTTMLKLLEPGPMLQSTLISNLRRKFNIKRQTIESRIKGWEHSKTIKKKGKEISLLISLPLHDNLAKTTVTRQENYCLKYPLKDPLDPKDPPIVIKLAGQKYAGYEEKFINGSRQATWHVGEITARLNTRSLELWCPHIYSNSNVPSIIMESKAKDILDNAALAIERDLQKNSRFKLIRMHDNITLLSERVDIELEEEEHMLAAAKPKDYKFEIYHPIDGQLRAKIDYSRGLQKPEAALLHKKDAGVDRDTMNKQFNMLFDGEVSLLTIPQLQSLMGRVEEVIRAQANENVLTEKTVRENYVSTQEQLRELQSVLKTLIQELKNKNMI